MTSLHCLSPEIIIEIMMMLGFHDLENVIETSPLFLQHFLAHRHQILKVSVNNLNNSNNLSPMFISALWLRSREPKTPVTKSEVQDAEQTSLRLYRRQSLELSTSSKLSLLSGAYQLLVEAEWIADSYAPQAWAEMQRDAEPYEQLQDFQVMSANEKRRLVEAALHFETYCRMFFVNAKILFKRNESIRQRFFQASSCVKHTAFYSIAYYVFDQYLSMMSKATATLSALNESNQKSRFEQQTRLEMLNFAHCLTSQGIGLLYKLQCMGSIAQTEFMVEWFYEVSQSNDPLVLMVNGIDLHRKGTLETRRWQPWEGIELESFRSSPSWRYGVAFWDHTFREA
ncbi:hypothetical protein FSST1_002640 [Fusarium sambucinum]